MRLVVACGAAAFALLLCSCATTYQALGPTGGYQDFRTGPDQFEVAFRGNGYTTPEEVYQFFLTRAAAIALREHYTSFYVLQPRDTSITQTYVQPGEVHSRDTVNVYRRYTLSRYGNIGYLDTTVLRGRVTWSDPPEEWSVTRPGFRGQVLLVNAPLKDQPAPFDAQTVYNDGMALKNRVDAQNQDVEAAGAAAAAAAIVLSVFLG